MEKRIACYARVSTVDQSTGLESQVRVLKQYCEQRSVPETWVTDYSGDIGNTFILKGSSTGSTLFPPSSKYPRS